MDLPRDAERRRTSPVRERAMPYGGSPVLPAAELSDAIFESGRVAARSLGMGDEDARDCACSFYLALALRPRRMDRILRAKDPPAFLARCARNFSIDYARVDRRRLKRETPQVSAGPDDACRDAIGADIGGRCPVGDELWEAIGPTLRRTTRRAEYLFRQHYGEGRTALDLANETGMSVPAVEQSLHRTLARVRESLRGKTC
jgi:DNA-directed RNA polymerase specialized sigma24 family protein